MSHYYVIEKTVMTQIIDNCLVKHTNFLKIVFLATSWKPLHYKSSLRSKGKVVLCI